jgi:RHS repeat-associated protein
LKTYIKEYLSYVTSSAGTQYRSDAKSRTEAYYNTDNYEYTLNPYSEKQFEASPLNRVLKQSAPGNVWAMGLGKEIKFEYQTNHGNEVKLYKVTTIWNATLELYTITLVNTSGSVYYPENTLYKTITKDENWVSGTLNTTEEFKDKEGRVVLKRTYGNSVVNDVETTVPHDTYYVYDVYGNLTYVIPPLVNTSEVITTTVLDDLCYQYQYDYRNRLVEKKLPGKGWEYIVYDKLDRVVATGPALNPFTDVDEGGKQGWLFTKYDAFSRPVLTGWQEVTGDFDSTVRKTLQSEHNTQMVLHESKPASDNSMNGVSYRYTNVAYPTTNYHILTVNYYDDYNYTGAPTSFDSVEGEAVYYNNTTAKPKGLPTGSWVRVLEGKTQTARELNWVLYDKKGRAIRSYQENHLGGYTQVDSKLDFTGKTLYTVTRHKRESSNLELYTKDVYTYSDQDRLLTHTHQIKETGIPQLLSKNEYDELGQLLVKRVGGTDVTGNAPLQKVDYSYTIRGWLKEINKVDNLTQGSDPEDLFAFKINYETPTNTVNNSIAPLYNGNISETYWKTNSDNQLRSYSYRYDALNRLQQAVYHKENVTQNSYNESLTYDKNGNIKSLERNGDLDTQGTTITIDDLSYFYSGNRLTKVEDITNHPEGFTDGADSTNEYGYDDYGNMVRDDNKEIIGIRYNHLNLPNHIEFDGAGKRIYYIYNALGEKIKKIISKGAPTYTSVATEYLNGYHYEGGDLKFFPTAEGYVNVTEGLMIIGGGRSKSYSYVYNYTDHLGNVRLSYTRQTSRSQPIPITTVLEENHYYPFGLKHKKYGSTVKDFVVIDEETEEGYYVGIDILPPQARKTYQYKYNGKEWQDELGLNFYDYGARNYDPAIGRWMNIDPLAEKFSNISSYVYTANSPVLYLDPDGKDIYLYYATKGNSKEDDAMFWQSALTKAQDFLSSDKYTGNDIFRIARVDDLASIETDAESFISKNSEKFGKTKEFGVWSHAGFDGPVGTAETSRNKLSMVDSKQMSLKGWGSIDFNWAKDARAYFYGCNTGVDPSGDKQAFNTSISLLGNFKDVSVYGQTSYSYPSQYANSRRPSANQLDGIYGKKGEPTYMVGGNRFTQPWIGWFGDAHFEAHKMSGSKNGSPINSEYQTGKTTN